EMLAFKREGITRERRFDQIDSFFPLFARAVDIDAEPTQRQHRIAAPCSKFDTAARKNVLRRNPLGHAQRMIDPIGHQSDRMPETDTLGSGKQIEIETLGS